MEGKNKKIVPAILVKNESELIKRINLIKDLVSYVQIDIMDNFFVPNETFFDWDNFKNLFPELSFELHLMVNFNDFWLEKVLKSGANRVIIHFESLSLNLLNNYLDKLKKAGIKVGLAINPETKPEMIFSFLEKIDAVLVMTVVPGFSGQEMIKDNLEKIKKIKDKKNNLLIGVDGGINEKNIVLVNKAGADYFCINNPLFKYETEAEIKTALLKLVKLIT